VSKSEKSAPRGRSLVTTVLTAQFAITALVGAVALAGLAWASEAVVRDKLADRASEWASELNTLGVPLYARDRRESVLDVERFVALYPEVQRITWYDDHGTVLLDVPAPDATTEPPRALPANLIEELAASVGGGAASLRTEGVAADRFRLSGPIWGAPSVGETATVPGAATQLLGFVSVDLDLSAQRTALLPQLAATSTVLLMLLTASWLGGRALMKRALQPLSALQQPLAALAEGDTSVQFPRPPHRELQAVVRALEHTTQTLLRREQRLRHLADHDPLTGLLNRQSFMNELEAEIERCAAQPRESALFFIDLDRFKHVNDTCGHSEGDQLLKLAAGRIHHSVRAEDAVARFGGDEFVVLVKDVTAQDAKAVAGHLQKQMGDVVHVANGQAFRLQCSIGVTMLGEAKVSAHELIARADVACQAAKSRGRNRVELYSVTGEQSEQMARDVRWSHAIRDALANDAFELHYQPLMHVRSGRVVHYEALLRLRRDGELVAPRAFLPAAGRFGLMPEIDCWVVRNAIRALAELRKEHPQLTLWVNISSSAFETGDFAGQVRSWLRRYDAPGEQLVLEIPEQLAVRFAVSTERQLAALRDLGCRFAVDDFGLGYGAFTYLKRLPVQYLKIDASLIENLVRDPVDQSMVRMVSEVAKAAGMETVVEHVHDAATLSLLARYGVDFAQGYCIGKSAPWPQPVALEPPRGMGAGT
jgi:diguanylate cyclase (GGDEF)-like protein